MACQELDDLRAAARKLYRALDEKVRKARVGAEDLNSAPSVYKTDYEPYLKHKLNMISNEIAKHLARHKCEEQPPIKSS